jgi:hypothetical protein
MTADKDWDPSVYDNDIDNLEEFHDTSMDFIDHDKHFDMYGSYRHCTIAQQSTSQEDIFVDAVEYCDNDNMVETLMDILNPHVFSDIFDVNHTQVEHGKPSFELLRTLFGWSPSDTIKRTFDVTTQYARGRVSDTLKQHWRSRFPACNVQHRNVVTKRLLQTLCLVIHLLSKVVLLLLRSLLATNRLLPMYMA